MIVELPRAPASVNRLRSMRHASGMSPLAASAMQPCRQREDDRPNLRLAGALGLLHVVVHRVWLSQPLECAGLDPGSYEVPAD